LINAVWNLAQDLDFGEIEIELQNSPKRGWRKVAAAYSDRCNGVQRFSDDIKIIRRLENLSV
jgi:hypothetical protein